MNKVRVVERRGTWFYFKHQAEQGTLPSDHPVVEVAHAALSITDTRTLFIPMEVEPDVAEVLRVYREEGHAATVDYLQRNPKVNWVPQGGWNTHPEIPDDVKYWTKVRREGPVEAQVWKRWE